MPVPTDRVLCYHVPHQAGGTHRSTACGQIERHLAVRYRREKARPDVGGVSSGVADLPAELPSHAQVQRQPRPDFPIILHEGAGGGQAVPMQKSLRDGFNAQRTRKDVSFLPDEQVVPVSDNHHGPLYAIVDKVPLILLVRPGNLVRILELVFRCPHREYEAVQDRVGLNHNHRRRLTASRTASRLDRCHAQVRRVVARRERVPRVRVQPLVRCAGFIDKVVGDHGGQPQ